MPSYSLKIFLGLHGSKNIYITKINSAAFGTAIILVCLALFPSCHQPWLAAVFMFLYGTFLSLHFITTDYGQAWAMQIIS